MMSKKTKFLPAQHPINFLWRLKESKEKFYFVWMENFRFASNKQTSFINYQKKKRKSSNKENFLEGRFYWDLLETKTSCWQTSGNWYRGTDCKRVDGT